MRKYAGGMPRQLFWVGVQIPMEDYKSLCVVVTICTNMVNTQTDRLTYRETDRWTSIG